MTKPAFRLRKATVEDFSIFYNFYVHSCYNWLFNENIAVEEDNPFEITFEDNYFFSKENMKVFYDDILNFNIHDFEKYLSWYKIFMIIVDKKIVGYVKMETYGKQFVIRNWTMHYEYMNQSLLDALLEEFETYAPKKAERIQIISLGTPLSRGFLEKHGYTFRCIPIFEKSCIKNPE